MKNFHLSALIAVFATLVCLPAFAQQAYSQQGFMPLNQGNVPGLSGGGMVNGAFQQVPAQGFQPMANQGGYVTGNLPPQQQFNPSQPGNGYHTSNLNTKSPYEQQELALQEARMLQELQELKQGKVTASSSSGDFERGQVSGSKRGKFAKAIGKVGSFVRKGAVAAAPAGAAVGTLFIMRAAFGPPATFMPVATPTGTAFIPMSR